jgi:hypothetical protein
LAAPRRFAEVGELGISGGKGARGNGNFGEEETRVRDGEKIMGRVKVLNGLRRICDSSAQLKDESTNDTILFCFSLPANDIIHVSICLFSFFVCVLNLFIKILEIVHTHIMNTSIYFF